MQPLSFRHSLKQLRGLHRGESSSADSMSLWTLGTMCSQCSGLKTFIVNSLVSVPLAFWKVGPPLRAATTAVHRLGEATLLHWQRQRSPLCPEHGESITDLKSEFCLDSKDEELIPNYEEMILKCLCWLLNIISLTINARVRDSPNQMSQWGPYDLLPCNLSHVRKAPAAQLLLFLLLRALLCGCL